MKGKPSSPEERPRYRKKELLLTFLLFSPMRICGLLLGKLCIGEKEIIFGKGPFGYWFLIGSDLGDHRKHCDSPGKVGAYGVQLVDGVLASISLIVEPMGP